MTAIPTPQQTAGPYLRLGMGPFEPRALVTSDWPGAIEISGRLLDGANDPVPDGVVEIWQADEEGRYPPASRPDWGGFGRCLTNDDGEFTFRTIKPGLVLHPSGVAQAPHLEVLIFARGLLHSLLTRLYFPDEIEANEQDPVLAGIADERARRSLIATGTLPRLGFDIHLQGEAETAFFGL